MSVNRIINSELLDQANVKRNLPNILLNGGMERWQRGTSLHRHVTAYLVSQHGTQRMS